MASWSVDMGCPFAEAGHRAPLRRAGHDDGMTEIVIRYLEPDEHQAAAAVAARALLDAPTMVAVHGDDPMPGVTKSFAYMRGVLAGMGYQA